jgi:CheY-like chemotaxis protein
LGETTINHPVPFIWVGIPGTAPQATANTHPVFTTTLTKPFKLSQFHDSLLTIFSERLETPRSSTEASAEPLAADFPLRILLAEDNRVNQKVAVRLLKKLGYQVDLVQNGIEATEAVQHQTYDLILMDVQMPTMDGLTATQHIRKSHPDANHPWIVALTANALEGDRQACLDAGMNDYLAKPIEVDRLVEVIHTCGRLTNGPLSESKPL